MQTATAPITVPVETVPVEKAGLLSAVDRRLRRRRYRRGIILYSPHLWVCHWVVGFFRCTDLARRIGHVRACLRPVSAVNLVRQLRSRRICSRSPEGTLGGP